MRSCWGRSIHQAEDGGIVWLIGDGTQWQCAGAHTYQRYLTQQFDESEFLQLSRASQGFHEVLHLLLWCEVALSVLTMLPQGIKNAPDCKQRKGRRHALKRVTCFDMPDKVGCSFIKAMACDLSWQIASGQVNIDTSPSAERRTDEMKTYPLRANT